MSVPLEQTIIYELFPSAFTVEHFDTGTHFEAPRLKGPDSRLTVSLAREGVYEGMQSESIVAVAERHDGWDTVVN